MELTHKQRIVLYQDLDETAARWTTSETEDSVWLNLSGYLQRERLMTREISINNDDSARLNTEQRKATHDELNDMMMDWVTSTSDMKTVYERQRMMLREIPTRQRENVELMEKRRGMPMLTKTMPTNNNLNTLVGELGWHGSKVDAWVDMQGRWRRERALEQQREKTRHQQPQDQLEGQEQNEVVAKCDCIIQ